MTHASLFSGIGGAEIAAEWVGWENAFHVEINPFGRKVLEYWYPNSTSYEDITKTDFSEWRGRVDVLTAGFPCQPFSVAGQRKGADDDRYLWPQVVRAVHEIRPAWVVGENVAGILTMVQPGEEVEVGSGSALFDENHLYRTEQQYVIETVCQDLEREGYSVQPFVIPACAVGAPHRRDRVWVVARRIAADTSRNGDSGRPGAVREEVGRQDYELRAEPLEHGGLQTMAAPDTKGTGIKGECKHRQREEKSYGRNIEDDSYTTADRWRDFPTQSPVCSGNDGLSIGLVGITFPKWRAEAIKALGNAWVTAVAYEIFRAIQQAENK